MGVGAREIAINKCPHLRSTVERFHPTGRGNCAQRSVAMVMDLPTAKLVVATVEEEGERYIHCWVEVRGWDYDPSRYEEDRQRLLPFDRDTYRQEMRAQNVRVVGRRFVMEFARRGALSRWMLAKHEPSHKLGLIMGDALLNELNVPHRMDGPLLLPPLASSGIDSELLPTASMSIA